ncbi:MAG: hypothetical protein IJV45_09085 [Prevotella sp.]|nr:hypothetical protein [Prevotella sp.]
MKKVFTQQLAAILLMVAALTGVQRASAQDAEITGYANVYIQVKAAPQGGGKVFVNYQESAAKAWRDALDFRQPVQVGEIYETPFMMLYLYANPNTEGGYAFAGWYADDGDGVFDIEKDVLMSTDADYLLLSTLPDDTPIYDTRAAAQNGTKPTEPSDLIFAYFSRGATVGLSYYQDDAYDTHANCGTVWISKELNEPGDQVTVRAIPNDGFHFEYWQDASTMGNVVSRENPYTFTVQGGEHLFAYFMADDAPEFDLPEEGGFAAVEVGETWVLSEESEKNGALVLFMEQGDLRNEDGRTYLDMSIEDSHVNVTQWRGKPSIIYGKGKVRFAYKLTFGIGGDDLVFWSGQNGVTLSDELIYVYVFVPELGAFVQYGSTDSYSPTYMPEIHVPGGLAYFAMSVYDLADDIGNVPTVIGLSPETYDRGMAEGESALQRLLDQLSGIEGVQIGEHSLKGHKVYTLSGVEVKTTPEKGVFIVNGKKIAIK